MPSAPRCRGRGITRSGISSAASWQRNDGIRIDHLLLGPQCADLLQGVGIDKHVRGLEKPSDHVPIWMTIDA